ncbi:MAG TPA: aspartate aminotransferase family protein [Candidatus Nitrosotenuis sp.]|jgi:putrescine aminotransferase|nr:aspartate aminotransferase family protein [Candidatus Nitrosotenuis sp.]
MTAEHKEELNETLRLYREHLSPDLARLLKISGYGTLETEARGTTVCDHQGHEYLDFAGGYGVFSLGHCHPEVVEAVQQQLHRMPLSAKVFLNPLMARLAAELARLAPGRLQYSFFCSTGAEAVEGALKLARLATGRSGFVAAEGAFHGKTLGALSVSGRPLYRDPFAPLLPGVRHVPFGDPAALEQAVDSTTAAVILEPVQGEGGIHPAPPGYLALARRLCSERGALLIADEVQCGLGRTGRMFAVEHFGVEPDIMTLAKALGGGVVPIGAFMGTPEVWKAFAGRPTLHTSTFGGNPLACAAALATLRLLERDDLPRRAAEMGAYMLEGLQGLVARFPDLFLEARGLGLMLGLEMREERFGGAMIMEMSRRRVIAVYTLNQPRVLRFEPPLTVSREEIDRCLEALEASARRTRQMFPAQEAVCPT